MTVYLTQEFINAVRAEPRTVTVDDRTLTLQRSDYRRGLIAAEVSVLEDGEIIGYITEYGRDEHGAVKAQLFGVGVPRLFRELRPALNEILGTSA